MFVFTSLRSSPCRSNALCSAHKYYTQVCSAQAGHMHLPQPSLVPPHPLPSLLFLHHPLSFSQVAIISPFNFPLEIPLLQLMGALYMGNKPTLKVDSKVRKAAPVLGS